MEAPHGRALGTHERGRAREVSRRHEGTVGLRPHGGERRGGNEGILNFVIQDRVEEPGLIEGVDEMNLNEMSLGELLYFALVEKVLPDFAVAS